MDERSHDKDMDVLQTTDYKHSSNLFIEDDDPVIATRKSGSRQDSQSSSLSSLKSCHTSSSIVSSSSPGVPPDGGWGWMIVFASFCCNVIVDGIIFSFGIILLEVSTQFRTSRGTTAWIGSLQAGCYLMIGPVVSALANRYGCRSVTLMGSLIASFGFFVSFWATSVLWLDITFGVIGGIGFGFIYLPAIVTVGYYFESKRAFATGIAVCGSGIGQFIMPPLVQYLIQCFGWRGCVLILSGLILNCVVFGSLFRPLDSGPGPSHQPLLSSHRESDDGDYSIDEEDDEIEEDDEETGNRVSDLQTLKYRFKTLAGPAKDWMSDGITNSDRLSMPDMMSLLRNSGTKRTSVDDPLDEERDGQAFRPRSMTGFSRRNYLHDLLSHDNNNGSFVSSQPTVGWRIRDFAGDPNLRLNSSLIVTRSQVFALNLQMDGKAWSPFPGAIRDPAIKRTDGVASGRREENRITTERGVNDQLEHRHQASGHKGAEDERQEEEGRKELPVGTKAQNDPLNESSEEEREGKRLRTRHQSQEVQQSKDLESERIASTKSMKIEMSEDSSSTTAHGVDPRDGGSIRLPVRPKDRTEHGRSACSPTSGEKEEEDRKERMEAGVGTPVTRVTRKTETRMRRERTSKSVVRSSSLMSDLMESLDPELLSSPSFLLLSVSGFLTLAGFFIPFTYIVDRAMIQACFAALRSVITVELLGLEKLTKAFGLLLLPQGIATIIGTPFAGLLYDMTGSYDCSFFVAGSLITLSGLMCVPLKRLSEWETMRKHGRLSV